MVYQFNFYHFTKVECEKGPSSDKQGFADLVKELRAAFVPRGLLLSAAVSASKRVIDLGIRTLINFNFYITIFITQYHFFTTIYQHSCFFKAYDVPVLARNLDWISLMTYDFHGQWDKKTGHIAPMYAHEADDDKTFNTVIYVTLKNYVKY